MKKNDSIVASCVDYSEQGYGVVKIEGFCIFVKGILKGEVAKIKLTAMKKNYGYAIVEELLEPSKNRVVEKCEIASVCGGCQLQHMNYEEQLNFKQNSIERLFERNHLECKVNSIIAGDDSHRYRNKVQVPFGVDKEGKLIYGFYRNHSNDIIQLDDCKIQSEQSNRLLLEIQQLLSEAINQKHLRHVLIKHMQNSDEIMVVFVAWKHFEELNKIVEALVKKHNNIKSCILNINTYDDNVILGKKEYLLYGENYVKDDLMGKTFLLSSKSFYQINSAQTAKLYQQTLSLANIQKNDVVLDLYGGIGTIGILASDFAKKVITVEVVKEAIEDGKNNAKLNQIENIEFFCGDVKKFMSQYHESVDIIIVDPPRKGIDVETIPSMLEMKAKRIVYVSCNPNTLIRDLKLMNEDYHIEIVQPVDMFPHTRHTEVIVLLQKS